MCSGYEYYLTECPGFNYTQIDGNDCPNENHQAGFRCVEGNKIFYFKIMETYSFPKQQSPVVMETHVWRMKPTSKLMELLFLVGEWGFATAMSTTQSVMKVGLTKMPSWCVAPTLAITLIVRVCTQVNNAKKHACATTPHNMFIYTLIGDFPIIKGNNSSINVFGTW